METTMNKRSMMCFKKVTDIVLSREETAESVVPDVLPDIGSILDADAIVFLKSKEAESGRVNITGTVVASVLYMPEDGSGIKRLSATMQMSASADSPAVTEKSKVVARLRVVSADARMLNPRKVLIRADIIAEIMCYERDEVELCDGVSADTKAEIQMLRRSARVSPVTAVTEKTFVLSDEYQLPSMKPLMGELLKQRAELFVDEIKTVGNKIVFKGIAQITALYLSRREDGEEGEPSSVSFSTVFSQIMELDAMPEEPEADISLMLTGAFFEPLSMSQDARAINVELHLVAQAVISDNMELTYLADAFSNDASIKLVSRETELPLIERRMTVRETTRDVMDTQSPVRDILHMYATPGPASLENGRVSCRVMLRIIAQGENGEMFTAQQSFDVMTSVEIDENMSVALAGVRCDETYASPSSGGIEVRLPVDFELVVTSTKRIVCVSEMLPDEEETNDTPPRPSITVLKADSSNSIWTLAKKYRSTPELIAEANGMSEDEESIVGRLLIIPRAR